MSIPIVIASCSIRVSYRVWSAAILAVGSMLVVHGGVVVALWCSFLGESANPPLLPIFSLTCHGCLTHPHAASFPLATYTPQATRIHPSNTTIFSALARPRPSSPFSTRSIETNVSHSWEKRLVNTKFPTGISRHAAGPHSREALTAAHLRHLYWYYYTPRAAH